jgi:hypothetical protein
MEEMMMGRFRKKPVVIEAVQWDGTELGWKRDIMPLAQSAGAEVLFCEGPGDQVALEIPTLEGVMTASNGDWIIRGIKNELYPCHPDIFAATYDPA